MLKMSPFRRKKADKSFPVKVITFDSELEFKLEVGVFSWLNGSQCTRPYIARCANRNGQMSNRGVFIILNNFDKLQYNCVERVARLD